MSPETHSGFGYPPHDSPKPVAEGIWVVDGGPVRPAGIPLPTRMTVIRLSSGELCLHSPIHHSDTLARHLKGLGPVGHLVAPSIGHWTTIAEWQRTFPEAVTWAVPNLSRRWQVRRSDLRIDRTLAETEVPGRGEIEAVIVPGLGGFREVAFFHSTSSTLILTDLLQRLEADRVPVRTRIYAKAVGTLSSSARAPSYLHAALRWRGRPARRAVSRLIEWQPERVIFAHGRWIDRDGTAALGTAFGRFAGGDAGR